MVWREAMALRAYGLETVEQSPAPAGRLNHDALGRDRPLIEDDAPACIDSGSPDYGVATNACRTSCATSHNGQDRTAGPLRGCQWILLVPRITRTENLVRRRLTPEMTIDAGREAHQLFFAAEISDSLDPDP